MTNKFYSEVKNMILKIYALVWFLGLLAAGVFYLTGNLGPVATVVFGFLTFGAIFMGMMGVLPSTVGHNAEAKR
jgi:hypothetical protein